ncbi:MAG: RHS repeat-associated core domain-containing protein [Methanobacteriota archaeon]|nr:MAG: RHS repeat-associated core domain-containing protein [Euryarchaeota archaeon]
MQNYRPPFGKLRAGPGNTRAVVNPSNTVVEAHDYPFGLLMPGRDYHSGSETKEKFTGKERDSETGLDYFGARYYSPALGRWLAVDPVGEKFPKQEFNMNQPFWILLMNRGKI